MSYRSEMLDANFFSLLKNKELIFPISDIAKNKSPLMLKIEN